MSDLREAFLIPELRYGTNTNVCWHDMAYNIAAPAYHFEDTPSDTYAGRALKRTYPMNFLN